MKRNDREDGQLSGLIDKGCSIQGKLAFDGTVQINGDFRGEIVSDGTLIIGPEARVEGNVSVGSIIVEGSVHGQVDAKNRIELRSGSKMIADIKSPAFVVDSGATFHGTCAMLTNTSADYAADSIRPVMQTSEEETGDSLMM